jgi:hypothetical protein
MSSLSEHDHLNPNEPTYYAPRWLRDRPEVRVTPSNETSSQPVRSLSSRPAASLDSQLENAVSSALWHPLDPEVIQEPPGLAEEMDRGSALITVAGRFAAAVGVSAIVALFFVIMVPASRLPDSGGSSGIVKSIKSALFQPGQREETSKPAIAEFQPVLAAASAQNGQPAPAAREQSGQLLQQFMQWRQKPGSTETTQ